MNLKDIWQTKRSDMRLVAYLPGTTLYIGLAYRTIDEALLRRKDIDDDARASDEWLVGEVVPDTSGQVAGIVNEDDRKGGDHATEERARQEGKLTARTLDAAWGKK